VLTAVLWLGESLQLAQVIGGAILLVGLAVVSGVGMDSRKSSV
jgi:drug/metabolite transporter (DMT)-like permease